jgi:thiol-disulfide isomerase/thioredoxin
MNRFMFLNTLFKTSFLMGLLLLAMFFIVKPAFAENTVNVYFFWGDGCPHCAKEKPFLEELENKYPSVTVHKYEIWHSDTNRNLLQKVSSELEANVSGVPFTVIGEKTISGYLNDETTGKEIEDAITYCLASECLDRIGSIAGVNNAEKKIPPEKDSAGNEKVSVPETITLPLVGEMRTRDVSLPVLTVLIAGLDGFNPCAMWTLLFLISLLLGMHDKKRMWILGSAFILASAGIYFLFMAAWLQLILFIGFIFWIRLAIGLSSLGAGVYNLREYFINKENACKVTRGEERRRVFDALKRFTQERHFWLALFGIIILAVAVNIVELICSAGLPVIYTQILTLSHLEAWQYYLYLLLYVFIFMLDDLFVFIISMKTLELTGVTTKYSRFSHLIGGILMLILGIILIFKPELLMFG